MTRLLPVVLFASLLVPLCSLDASSRSQSPTQVVIVNMIPNEQSDETNDDTEPNVAVDAATPMHISGTAFTPNPNGGDKGPLYVSKNGGDTWTLNPIVPSEQGSTTGTGDITVRFASSSHTLYGGILRIPDSLFHPRINLLRTHNYADPTPMQILFDQENNGFDQPYVEAITANGKDCVYVGCNDFNAPNHQTATILCSLDPGAAAPTFTPIRIESRSTGTAQQDAPSIRIAPHPDGTVYAAFFGWRTKVSDQPLVFTSDVVVVRDDNGGGGTAPFTALKEAPPPTGDGLSGVRVATGRTIPWDAELGQDRTGSDLAIAVDPTNSSAVFIAWADRVGANDYTLHLRNSTNRGVSWSGSDLRTITNAKNPALAINKNGKLAFFYQQLDAAGATPLWVTHLELTTNAFGNKEDLILAKTPVPGWLGDYAYLTTVDGEFYGVFCAINTPDPANFPALHGELPKYQRNIDSQAKTLRSLNQMNNVNPSIDPFFFRTRGPSQ